MHLNVKNKTFSSFSVVMKRTCLGWVLTQFQVLGVMDSSLPPLIHTLLCALHTPVLHAGDTSSFTLRYVDRKIL